VAIAWKWFCRLMRRGRGILNLQQNRPANSRTKKEGAIKDFASEPMR
jgi:hypothetical protein